MLVMANGWARTLRIAVGLARARVDELRDAGENLAQDQAERFWERAHYDLRQRFSKVTESMRKDLDDFSSGSGGNGDGYSDYPLHWYGSVGRSSRRVFTSFADMQSAPRDPEIYLTADFRRDGDVLRYNCEITLNNQQTLRQGPVGVVAIPHGVLGSYLPVKSALAEIGRFIDGSGPFLREQLRALA